MKKAFSVIPAALCLALLPAAVFAQSGAAPKAEEFVNTVAISDMYEIESSKLAQTNAQDAKVKSFASKMVTDHTETSNQLKALTSGGKVKAQLPAALDNPHQSKLDKLKGLKGADFDKQYQDDQESAHKDAVTLFDRYAKSGDNADLKNFAAKTLPHLQEHLKLAQDLKKK